jgi:hypothetical protein
MIELKQFNDEYHIAGNEKKSIIYIYIYDGLF